MVKEIEMIENMELVSEKLEVLKSIKKSFGLDIVELDEDYAKIMFNLEKAHLIDDTDIVFEADIYNVAHFTALASINEPGYFVISAYMDFLTQVNLEEKSIYFVGNVKYTPFGKREVEVKGFVNDIAVFEGIFSVLKVDQRSKVKIKPIKKEKNS